MATHFSSKEQFSCEACGLDYDREIAVPECRMCHRTHCKDCLDDQGLCVPCREK